MTTQYVGTKAQVIAAAEKIYCNTIKAKAIEGDGTLYINPPATDKIIAASATEEELCSIPILGIKGGKLNKTGGFTISWATPKQRYDDNTKWYIPKHPELEMNDGVINVVEEAFDESWEAPEEVI